MIFSVQKKMLACDYRHIIGSNVIQAPSACFANLCRENLLSSDLTECTWQSK